jgi:hypothetical protein
MLIPWRAVLKVLAQLGLSWAEKKLAPKARPAEPAK